MLWKQCLTFFITIILSNFPQRQEINFLLWHMYQICFIAWGIEFYLYLDSIIYFGVKVLWQFPVPKKYRLSILFLDYFQLWHIKNENLKENHRPPQNSKAKYTFLNHVEKMGKMLRITRLLVINAGVAR